MATEAPVSYIDTLLKRVASRGVTLGIRVESGSPVGVTGGNAAAKDATTPTLSSPELTAPSSTMLPDARVDEEAAIEVVVTREPAVAVVAPAPVAPIAPAPIAPIAPVAPIAPIAPPVHTADPHVHARVGAPPIDRLFKGMCDVRASDLHLCVGMPPLVRKDGEIQRLEENSVALDPESLWNLLDPIIPERSREEYERRHDTDFAYEVAGLGRFRSNIFMDRKGPGAVFRVIPSKILTAEDLGLSPFILKLCTLNKGLVLVTGPTGSGKSTTLCAMVDYINRTRKDHIITIEDPIEFV